MNTIHLRPYAEQDHAACVAMFEGNTPRFFSMTELPDFEQFLTDLRHPFWVIENEDQEIIGCGGVTFVADKSSAGLCWGMIRNDMHRQGLGRFLFLARLVYISQQTPDCLVTNDTNQYTCGFFERMGFHVTQVTHDHYALDIHRYDMEFQLNKDRCAQIIKDLEEYGATIRYKT
jgi:N-acetylglutamate synthase-like GNAT family acetyltransferase